MTIQAPTMAIALGIYRSTHTDLNKSALIDIIYVGPGMFKVTEV